MHYVGRSSKNTLTPHPTYENHSEGYTQAALVDHTTGSVHTGLSLNQLVAGGTLSPHLHSYEEGFYILAGEALVSMNEQTYRLGPGDYAAIKVGTAHAWRNTAGREHQTARSHLRRGLLHSERRSGRQFE